MNKYKSYTLVIGLRWQLIYIHIKVHYCIVYRHVIQNWLDAIPGSFLSKEKTIYCMRHLVTNTTALAALFLWENQIWVTICWFIMPFWIKQPIVSLRTASSSMVSIYHHWMFFELIMKRLNRQVLPNSLCSLPCNQHIRNRQKEHISHGQLGMKGKEKWLLLSKKVFSWQNSLVLINNWLCSIVLFLKIGNGTPVGFSLLFQ